MKKLLILSGKGGTGKTTTASAFIDFSSARAFADCDVDAPNLHLVTGESDGFEKKDFYGSQKAVIDADACTGCGACAERCRFGAIRPAGNGYAVDEFACEGCGVCLLLCRAGAVSMQQDVAGEQMLKRNGTVFSTAKLKMGRGNSGKLVTEVKNALYQAAPPDTGLAVIDGSPGIGCPVIASISGVDLVLVVTEPSLSGISDLKRILKTAEILGTKTAVCVNRADTCPENARTIEAYCRENGISFVGTVPYDSHVPRAVNEGHSIARVDCPARDALWEVYHRTLRLLQDNKNLKGKGEPL